MGFPVCYSDFMFSKLIFHILSVFSIIRKLISTFFRFIGLQDFIEPHTSGSHNSTQIIHEILPVVSYKELVDPPDNCAVCLNEFEEVDEIRRLANCTHVFHRGCLDRWIEYDQKTCPLCRTPFIPHDMQGAFDERLWATSAAAL
ncbi:PREDICTED: E3 ubiquitin-protein ligase RHA1B-like [Lupinus angustifolius]|uniref:E3 ubiquitin-protein ligase RHA1B-like n=1 Tax=Lupinus angustifolius TaxID=3871 RepID=UPI00092EF355|nr:PREDICTED: E3 ubiquitin-protein ligase RHA1B-like [Lupinus angustifolius]